LRVESLKATKSDRLAAAQRELAGMLMRASRPADAAPYLAEACAALASTGGPDAAVAWNEWIDALLAADDPAAIKALADQKDAGQFDAAYSRLTERLSSLVEQSKPAIAIALCDEAIKQLSPRLKGGRLAEIQKIAQDAKTAQAAADKQKVAKLCQQLAASDEPARKAAGAELAAMGERVVEPLAAELKRNITSEKPSAELEKAILAVLRQVAPKLAAYDPDGPVAEKLKVIDGWIVNKPEDHRPDTVKP